jgi:hypothetical protein
VAEALGIRVLPCPVEAHHASRVHAGPEVEPEETDRRWLVLGGERNRIGWLARPARTAKSCCVRPRIGAPPLSGTVK